MDSKILNKCTTNLPFITKDSEDEVILDFVVSYSSRLSTISTLLLEAKDAVIDDYSYSVLRSSVVFLNNTKMISLALKTLYLRPVNRNFPRSTVSNFEWISFPKGKLSCKSIPTKQILVFIEAYSKRLNYLANNLLIHATPGMSDSAFNSFKNEITDITNTRNISTAIKTLRGRLRYKEEGNADEVASEYDWGIALKLYI